MKSIQKLFALSLMIFLSINLATAQRGYKSEDAETQAQKQTERMTEQLSLTASQTEQVAEINLAYAQKMKAVKADNTDKEATKAAMKPLRAEKSAAIKSVLTPEQLTKYEAKGDRKRGGKKGKGGKKVKYSKGDRGQKMGTPQQRAQKQTDRMAEQLSLTDNQKAKVADINLSYAQKMEAAKNSDDKEASKAAFKNLRAEKQEAIKAVLTAEQLAKYNEQKDSKRGGKGKGGKKAK